MEFCLMHGITLSYHNVLSDTNFQKLLGPGPKFKPTALYYAMLFLIYTGRDYPTLVLPYLVNNNTYISKNIKAWGFTSTKSFKVLILNKDMNASLTGFLDVRLAADADVFYCVYL
jgi:hypothetical protein